MATINQCDCCGKLMKHRGFNIGNEFRDCCHECVGVVMDLLRMRKIHIEAHTPLRPDNVVPVGNWDIVE